MRVKITGCCNDGWYSNQIGSIVNVTQGEGKYYIAFTFDGRQYYIEECDSVVVPEENPQPEPFDLERALKGEKVFTRDGRKVIILSDKSIHPTQPVIGDIDFEPGAFGLRWSKDGLYCSDGVSETGLDLFMAPKQPQVVTRWVNIYHNANHDDYSCGVLFSNENPAYANGIIDKYFIKTIPVTFTL